MRARHPRHAARGWCALVSRKPMCKIARFRGKEAQVTTRAPAWPARPRPSGLPRARLESARVADGRDAHGIALRVRGDGELEVVGRALRTGIRNELIRRV